MSGIFRRHNFVLLPNIFEGHEVESLVFQIFGRNHVVATRHFYFEQVLPSKRARCFSGVLADWTWAPIIPLFDFSTENHKF